MIALVELISKIYAASLYRALWWRVADDLATLTRCNRVWLFGQGAEFVPTAGPLAKMPREQVIAFLTSALGSNGRAPNGRLDAEGALVAADRLYWIPFQRNPAPKVLVPDPVLHPLFALALSRESRAACEAVWRDLDAEPGRHDPAQLISDLAPHLVSSYEIARTLARNEVYLGGQPPAVTRAQAVFVLGAGGKVIFATPGGHELLRAGDGLHLEGGALRPSAIWSSGGDGAGRANGQTGGPALASTCISIGRGRDKLPLFVLNFALDREHASSDAATPRSVAVVCDPEMRAARVCGLLRQTWPLTEAEAKVAAQLFLGRSIDDVAYKLNVKRETIRTHLKRTFAKTGTSNQAELVSFIAAIQSIHFPF